MVIINLKADDYYTQRNNEIDSANVCGPTSRVMFYKGNNLTYENKSLQEFGIKLADDDYFTRILRTPEARAFCDKYFPWAKSYQPNEVAGMFPMYLDVKLFGKTKSKFVENLTFENYLHVIDNKGVIMTNGTFGRIQGHVIVVVGRDERTLLLADPYGDYHTDYKNPKGYLIPMTESEFNTHIKDVKKNVKWGHILLNEKLD